MSCFSPPLIPEEGGAFVHSKKCWVVLTEFWVKYGQTQPLGKKFHLKM